MRNRVLKPCNTQTQHDVSGSARRQRASARRHAEPSAAEALQVRPGVCSSRSSGAKWKKPAPARSWWVRRDRTNSFRAQEYAAAMF